MANKFESALNELDELTNDPLFYREDVSTMDSIKNKIKVLITTIREELPDFFEKLINESGEKLPEWIYKAVTSSLDDILVYIDKKLENESNSAKKVAIEIFKNIITQFRERVKAVETFIKTTKDDKDSSSSSN